MPNVTKPKTGGQVFDDIIDLMKSIDSLRPSSRRLLMRKLEAAYVATVVDSGDVQANKLIDGRSFTLNQMDMLDGVRLYLHSRTGEQHRDNAELERLQPGEL
jgi:hypothetical protein